MRIIGGSARGRTLKTPVGQDIRPTSDKVRLAIFNALFSRGGILDAIVIDAFCGTGALGLEALSQGAQAAYFFDNARISLALTKENAADLGFVDQCQFVQKDAAKLGEKPAANLPATHVFLDPPYRKNLVAPALDGLKSGGWLTPDAMIIVETEADATPLDGYGDVTFDKIYGDTRVYFIQI